MREKVEIEVDSAYLLALTMSRSTCDAAQGGRQRGKYQGLTMANLHVMSCMVVDVLTRLSRAIPWTFHAPRPPASPVDRSSRQARKEEGDGRGRVARRDGGWGGRMARQFVDGWGCHLRAPSSTGRRTTTFSTKRRAACGKKRALRQMDEPIWNSQRAFDGEGPYKRLDLPR